MRIIRMFAIVVRSEDGMKSLLDIPDEHLRKLRMKLLELRCQQPLVRYVELPPMPVREEQLSESSGVCPRGTTPDAFFSPTDQEYSPLPQMCKTCARRKPLQHDFSSVIKAALSDSHRDNISKNLSDTKGFQCGSLLKTSRQKTLPLDTEKNIPYAEQAGDNFEDDSTDLEEISVFSCQIEPEKRDPTKSDQPERGRNANFQVELESSHSSSSDSVSPVQPEENVLSTCPLCTMEFEKGTSQMDIDGHIAACLAAAGDDVMW